MQANPVTIAAVQAAPVFLDRDATIDKACTLIEEAGRNGARLVVFPEAFVAAYPDWIWLLPPGQQQHLAELYATLVDQAVTIPGPTTELLGRAARAAGVYVAMGVNERNAEASNASVYNTLLYLDPQGQVLGRHRKLVPTAAERMVWAPGQDNTLAVYETPFGRIGGLICWENYMPLARTALYRQGVEIYVAPTWARGPGWQATLKHIAQEGRMYVVNCAMALQTRDIPERFSFKQHYGGDADRWIHDGESAIIGPGGEVVAGPLHQAEGVIYAEVDRQHLQASRWMFDAAGHYARPDVLDLVVRAAVPRRILSQPRATVLSNDAEQEDGAES